ncbi:hypothetical protein ACFLRA_03330, partial [Bdellovibrionota bacterium]
MNAVTISSLIAAFITTSLGIAVLHRSRRQWKYAIFAISCFLFAAWNLFYFLSEITESNSLTNAHHLLTIFLGPVTLHLFLTLMNRKESRQKNLIRFSYLIASFLAVISILFLNQAPFFTWINVIFAFGCVVTTLNEIRKFLKSTGGERDLINWKYIFAGGIIVTVALLADLFPKAGLSFPPFGNLFLIIFLYFIFEYVTKGRVFEFEELIAKVVHFSIIVFTLTIIYTLLVSWVGNKPWLFVFNTGIASFVILVLFDPIKTVSETLTNRLFFKEYSTSERDPQHMAEKLVGIVDRAALCNRLLDTLDSAFQAGHSLLFL